MFSSSIQKKLTFLIILLLVPTVVLLYVAKHIVSNKLDRIKIGKTGLDLIEQVWLSTEKINLGSETKISDIQSKLNNYLQSSSLDKDKQDAILKRWDTAKNEEKSSTKRLLASQRLIADLAKSSDLTSLISEISPDFAVIAFDRLPELSYRIENLTSIGKRLQNKETLGQSDIMAFLVNAGQFKAVADYVSRNSRNASNGFKLKK